MSKLSTSVYSLCVLKLVGFNLLYKNLRCGIQSFHCADLQVTGGNHCADGVRSECHLTVLANQLTVQIITQYQQSYHASEDKVVSFALEY